MKKICYLQSHICGVCGNVMQEGKLGRKRLYLVCTKPDCENWNIKFKYPEIALELTDDEQKRIDDKQAKIAVEAEQTFVPDVEPEPAHDKEVI